jgi:hypothetical protein
LKCAPIATILPSAEIAVLNPLRSSAASPSISPPSFAHELPYTIVLISVGGTIALAVDVIVDVVIIFDVGAVKVNGGSEIYFRGGNVNAPNVIGVLVPLINVHVVFYVIIVIILT